MTETLASVKAAPRAGAGGWLAALLLVLTVFGPISMDLYLPALPALTDELGASTSLAQLTITACLFGLAGGQLIAGPLSDRFGRRRPLLTGVATYVAVSALCAASPTVEALVAARLLQGLAGGVGIVMAQAAGRDVYHGGQLVRFYGRLTVTGGFAAIVGPMLGGALTAVMDWRGLFLVLAVIGAAILVCVATGFRETHPPHARASGGFARNRRNMGLLLADRRFVGAVLVQGFVNAAIFAYLAGATFVLQGIYGLSPQQYAMAFGLNSAGFMAFGYLSGRLSERWSVTGMLAVGLSLCGAGAAGLLVAGLAHVPLAVVMASLFLVVGGAASVSPPSTTLALADYPQMAGTASSVLGAARFAFGGIAAPFVGVAGALSILPLGLVAAVVIALAALAAAAFLFRRPDTPAASPRCCSPSERPGYVSGAWTPRDGAVLPSFGPSSPASGPVPPRGQADGGTFRAAAPR
ncbi:multidrug effflux MFS transporter [Sinomonas flava]|uniref:Multidrug effflux MFS transporter n=1 Tax=Sinomonas flava TaxID=496857 RepID=A0ABP5NN52_9MICC